MPMLVDELGIWVAGKLVEHGADKLLEQRHKLKKPLRSTWRRITKGKTVVLINGLGGAGKSTLQKILSGEKSIEQLEIEYKSSLDNEKTSLSDDLLVRIYTRPGQEINHRENDDEIKSQLFNAKRIILINVVSYGYNTQDPMTAKEFAKEYPADEMRSSVEVYLNKQRTLEVERLSNVHKILLGLPSGKKLDILTVATKIDLWHHEQDAAFQHYMAGPYAEVLKKIEDDSNFLARSTLSCLSLVLLNLRSSDGRVLIPLSPGFDVALRNAYYGHFATSTLGFFK